MQPERVRTPLVPELDVTDLACSLRFYVDVIGFTLVFERAAERFAYLAIDDAELMVQEAAGPGRRFRTAPLERPFGRGVNLQILVADVDQTYAAVLAAGLAPVIDLEERWYDVDVVAPSGRWAPAGPMTAGNRQFVVCDPDGYLLRFYTSLGARPR
jgi:catechol 2,3-dioxygenase-like lactoylglutathione lyase family enzyme